MKISFTCSGCLKEKKGNRMYVDNKPYCNICGKFLLHDKEFREAMKSNKLDISRPRKVRKNCKVLGICGILDAHHQILKSDPDRLTTEFMIKLICNDEKLEEYKKRDLSNIPYIPMELIAEE